VRGKLTVTRARADVDPLVVLQHKRSPAAGDVFELQSGHEQIGALTRLVAVVNLVLVAAEKKHVLREKRRRRFGLERRIFQTFSFEKLIFQKAIQINYFNPCGYNNK
jgi:hypothetical protein